LCRFAQADRRWWNSTTLSNILILPHFDVRYSLRHDGWPPWLEANAGVLGFSDRTTATRVMKAAKQNDALTHHLSGAEPTLPDKFLLILDLVGQPQFSDRIENSYGWCRNRALGWRWVRKSPPGAHQPPVPDLRTGGHRAALAK
jgi:hypothetical protein